MLAAQCHEVIQALRLNRSNPAFDVGVRIGCKRRQSPGAQTVALELRIKVFAKFAIRIVEHNIGWQLIVADVLIKGFGLLADPGVAASATVHARRGSLPSETARTWRAACRSRRSRRPEVIETFASSGYTCQVLAASEDDDVFVQRNRVLASGQGIINLPCPTTLPPARSSRGRVSARQSKQGTAPLQSPAAHNSRHRLSAIPARDRPFQGSLNPDSEQR